jgi:hypothetical protein
MYGAGRGCEPVVYPTVAPASAAAKIARDFEAYIVSPALGDQAGVIGALHLAQEANPSTLKGANMTLPSDSSE